MCHGHELDMRFSAALWTFYFETDVKHAVRYEITQLQKGT